MSREDGWAILENVMLLALEVQGDWPRVYLDVKESRENPTTMWCSVVIGR
jgi:hypothetical protein